MNKSENSTPAPRGSQSRVLVFFKFKAYDDLGEETPNGTNVSNKINFEDYWNPSQGPAWS